MKAAETFHTTMLPNWEPIRTLDISPWTYTLTQAARGAFFFIAEEILVNICQMFLPFFMMLFAGSGKKFPCCMSFSMFDGTGNAIELSFCQPCPYAYAPIGSRIAVGKIVRHQSHEPCRMNLTVFFCQYFVRVKERPAPIGYAAGCYGEDVGRFMNGKLIHEFLHLYGESQIVQRKDKTDTFRTYGEILLGQFLRDRAKLYIGSSGLEEFRHIQGVTRGRIVVNDRAYNTRLPSMKNLLYHQFSKRLC